MEKNKWLQVFQPQDNAKLRVIGLHYAGGSASIYRPWLKKMPEGVELSAIQLPGRWERGNEPLISRMAPLMEELAEAMQSEVNRPYLLVGFSLGGIIGFELMRNLKNRGCPLPVHFISISRRAPHVNPEISNLSSMSDDEFLKYVDEKYKGVPQIFFVDEDFKKLFLPILRADMEIFLHYKCEDIQPLPVPFTVIAGKDDSTITDESFLSWSEHTSESFEHHYLDAGHFLKGKEDELFEIVLSKIKRYL